MSSIQIWNDADSTYYRVNFTLNQSALYNSTGRLEYYLLITTSMTDPNNKSLGNWLVRTLNDVPPGGTPATDFSDLCRQYINYFIEQSRLLETSSSSSNSSSSSILKNSTSSNSSLSSKSSMSSILIHSTSSNSSPSSKSVSSSSSTSSKSVSSSSSTSSKSVSSDSSSSSIGHDRTVSGTNNPNVNGSYTLTTAYNGKNSWTNGVYYIWYYTTGLSWIISTSQGSYPGSGDAFILAGSYPNGTYAGIGLYTGNAIVVAS